MEKITPSFCAPVKATWAFYNHRFRFSHKVLWNRFDIKLAKNPFSFYKKDTFIKLLLHDKAFFVFDHSNDPLTQSAFINFAKPFLDIFKEHNINTNRIIVLSPSPDPFFYLQHMHVSYASYKKNTPLQKQFHHIQHTYLWNDLQHDFTHKVRAIVKIEIPQMFPFKARTNCLASMWP